MRGGMSMICNLARISAARRQALHDDPESITGFLYPDRASDRPVQPSGFLSRLFGRQKEPAPRQKEVLDQADQMDLDKAWHALHFLFTGSDWEGAFPAGFLVSGGTPVGTVDVGYGPARSYTPGEVEKIAAFLAGVDEKQLRARFDPLEMAKRDIYPSIWDGANFDADGEWDYFGGALQSIQAFLADAASRKMALLVYIN